MAIQPIITTPNIKQLQAFYTKVFGATQVRRVPETGKLFYQTLALGGGELGLVAKQADLSAPQRILLSIAVDDVDALLPKVEAAGGRVQGPPNDMPWGQRVAHVYDPDGNAVNLTQDI